MVWYVIGKLSTPLWFINGVTDKPRARWINWRHWRGRCTVVRNSIFWKRGCWLSRDIEVWFIISRSNKRERDTDSRGSRYIPKAMTFFCVILLIECFQFGHWQHAITITDGQFCLNPRIRKDKSRFIKSADEPNLEYRNQSYMNLVKKPPPTIKLRGEWRLKRNGSPYDKALKVAFGEGRQKFTSSTRCFDLWRLNHSKSVTATKIRILSSGIIRTHPEQCYKGLYIGLENGAGMASLNICLSFLVVNAIYLRTEVRIIRIHTKPDLVGGKEVCPAYSVNCRPVLTIGFHHHRNMQFLAFWSWEDEIRYLYLSHRHTPTHCIPAQK